MIIDITSKADLIAALAGPNAAHDGDTLRFAPGDYTGVAIDINDSRALTLTSANAGIDPDNWAPGSEVKVDRIVTTGNISVDGIYVYATIGGTDQNSSNGPYWQGIGTSLPGTSVSVKNSIIEVHSANGESDPNFDQPFGMNLTAGATSVVVDHVHFGPMTGLNPVNTAFGIYLNMSAASAPVTITNNVFETDAPRNAGVALAGQHDGANVVISGNSFEDPGTSPGAIRIFDYDVARPGALNYAISNNSMAGDGPMLSNETESSSVPSNSDDTFTGTAADETFVADGGNDTIDGAGGSDTISYETNTSGVLVDLATQLGFGGSESGIDTLISIENVQGGSGNDLLRGDAGDNVFFASKGVDQVDGRDGSDTFDSSAYASNTTVNLSLTTNNATGYSGAATTKLTNVENVSTGDGNDTITGNGSANTLSGHGGDDVFNGGLGNDVIIGGETGETNGDIAIYSAVPTGITATATGWQVTGGQGTDTLYEVEILQTNDPDGAGGSSGRVLLVGNGGFDTIQEAIDAAGNGDTILIAGRDEPYLEQLDITGKTNLTIEGRGDVVIKAPAGALAANADSSWGAVHAVVAVEGSTNFVIKGVTIDGDYAADRSSIGGDEISGIIFRNSTGSIDTVEVQNIGADPDLGLFGMQYGSGILVDFENYSANNDVKILNSNIHDFQKTGILVNKADVVMTDNTVTGVGATNLIAQNAVQVARSTGTISGNTLENYAYTGGTWDASGLILYEVPAGGAISVTGNQFTGAGTGIGAAGLDLSDLPAGSDVTVTGNDFQHLRVGMSIYGYSEIGLNSDPDTSSNTYADILDQGVWFDAEYSGTHTSVPFTEAGSNFSDYFRGSDGADTFTGLAGADTFAGSAGGDNLSGGSDDDTFIYSSASDFTGDVVDGGDGTDTIEYASTTDGDALVLTSDVTNVEVVTITSEASLSIDASAVGNGLEINGNDATNELTGTAFADQINGGGGADVIAGNGGADVIDGGAGMDTVQFAGNYADATITWDGTTATVTIGAVSTTVTDAGTLQFADREVFLVSQTSDEFSTIQSAVDASSDHDVVLVAGGPYTEDVTIAGRAISIEGQGSVTIKGQIDVTGVLAGDDVVGFKDLTIDATGKSYGINVRASAADIPGVNEGTVSLDGVNISNAREVGLFYANPDNGSSPLSGETVGSFIIVDSNFTNNGQIQTGAKGQGHVNLFGFNGNLTVTNSDFTSPTSGLTIPVFGTTPAGTEVYPHKAISISGIRTGTAGVERAPAGDVQFNDVTVSGTYGSDAVSLYDLGSFTPDPVIDIDFVDASAPWGLVNLDGVGGTVDLSQVTGTNGSPGAPNSNSQGLSSNDHFTGTAGNDLFDGRLGADTLDGGDGNDVFDYSSSAEFNGDHVDGGAGTADTISFTSSAAGTLVLTADVINVEVVTAKGSAELDIDASAVGNGLEINGNDATNALTGTAFADQINGGGGADVIAGNGGADVIDGGAGMDTVQFAGNYADATITWDGTTATVTIGAVSTTVTDAGTLQFADREVFLVSQTSDEFSTIQSAVDASSDHDVVLVAGGPYTEDVTIAGRAISIEGQGSVTIKGQIDVTGVLAGDDVVGFKDLTIDATGKSYGINVRASAADIPGVNEGTVSLDGVNISNAREVGLFYANPDNGSSPLSGETVGSFIIVDSNFTNNGQIQTGAKGQGHVNLFGFNGNLTVTNSDFTSPTSGLTIPVFGTTPAGTEVYPHKAISISGIRTGTAGVERAPAGDVQFNDVTVSGTYGSDAVSLYDLGSFTPDPVIDIDFVDASAPWGLVNLDGVGGTVDLSQVTGTNGSPGAPNSNSQGLSSNDHFTGTAGNDLFDGRLGADTLDGGDGNDVFDYSSSAEFTGDHVDGGAGTADTISFTSSAAGTLVLTADVINVEVVTAKGSAELDIDASAVGNGLAINGNSASNELTGTASTDTIKGGAGADVITGNGGNDVIDGGTGTDTAKFSGSFDAADLSVVDGKLVVTSTQGTDTLSGVEQLQFGDARVLVVGGGSEYATLSQALAAAEDGDTILILDGVTLTEQVTIDGFSDLTIMGMGVGSVVQMPDDRVLNNDGAGDRNVEAVISVINSTGVVIKDLKVDARGLGPDTSGNDYSGIYYGNSSGSVEGATVVGVRYPLEGGHVSGMQEGRAIYARNFGEDPLSFSATGNTVSDFQKNGIDVRGNYSATVSGNTITGGGLLEGSGANAQNGVVVGFGATGTVSGNTIGEIGNHGSSSPSSGVLVYQSGDAGVAVSGNHISAPSNGLGGYQTTDGIGVAINGEADNVSVTGNDLHGVAVGIDASGNVDGFEHGTNTYDQVAELNLNLDASDNDMAIDIDGTAGNDAIIGSDFADIIDGGAGNDLIEGGAGADNLSGGSDDDTFIYSSASDFTGDVVDGGDGTDTIEYASTTDGDALVLTADVTNVEVVTITSEASLSIDASAVGNGLEINGNDATNALTGTAFADQINGGGGADVIAGNGGADVIDGGAGMDTVQFAGNYADATITWDGTTATVTIGAVSTTVTDAGTLQFADREVFLVSQTSDEFSTIQSAVDASSDHDVVLVAGGPYTEDVTIAGRAISIEGQGSVTIKGQIDVTGVLAGDDVVGFKDLTIDATGKSYGINVRASAADIPGVNEGTVSLDGVNISNAREVGLFYANPDNGSSPLSGETVGSFIIVDSNFTNNGQIQTGAKGQGHVNLFGFNGNLTVTNSDFTSPTSGLTIPVFGTTPAGTEVYPHKAISISGIRTGTAGVERAPAGDVQFNDVTVSGTYGSDAVSLYDLGSFTPDPVIDIDFVDASAPWGLVNLDGVGGTVDLSQVTGTNGSPGAPNSNSQGLSSNDHFTGTAGNDLFDGRLGADTLDGGDGNDVFDYSSSAEFTGDHVDGGAGTADTISFTSSAAGTLVLTADVINVEVVTATGSAELDIDASAVGNGLAINGNSASNELTGTASTDTIKGGAGADVITGNGGNDVIDGGTGIDTAKFSGSFDAADLSVVDGKLVVTSTQGTDTLSGVEQLQFGDARVLVVGGGSEYATLSQALAAAEDGDTILILDGVTLTEQVTIDGFSDLTIMGMGVGSVVQMPDDRVLNNDGVGDRNVEAVISVINSTGVVIKDLKVDARGLGPDTSGNDYSGIYYGNSSGSVEGATVVGVRYPLEGGHVSGMQEGRAIYARNFGEDPLSFSATGNTVSDFQKNGIDVRGNYSATVSGNTITGGGLLEGSGANAQNGVVVGFGATGTVSGNTIGEIGNHGSSSPSSGVLVYQSGDAGVAVSGNHISAPSNGSGGYQTTDGIGVAINGEADNVSVTGNDLHGVAVGIDASGNVDGFEHGTNTYDQVAELNLNLDASDNDAAIDIDGTAGNDAIIGSDFADIIDGGAGNDSLVGGKGDDTITGGTGIDTASYGELLQTSDFSSTATAWTVASDLEGTDTLSGAEVVASNGKTFRLVGHDGYASIGAGVTAADASDTTLVSGNYAETVTVTKATDLVLKGDASLAPATGRGIDINPANNAAELNMGAVAITLEQGAKITALDDAIRINRAITNSTVTITNAGTIQSGNATTKGGQALDFASATGTTSSIHIINQATGVITAYGADGVRPGVNSTIDNYGTISSQIASSDPNDVNDAIDFQAAGTGTVNNYGTITGAQHGVTGDKAITVTNNLGAAITGQSGSAINIDNTTGTVVVNNYGTLTGNASASQADSDGDAVDVDGLLNITNLGSIAGTGAYGYHDGTDALAANISEGIAAGGGTIVNGSEENDEASITGYGRAIQIDNSANGGANNAVTITNWGTIEGQGHGPAGSVTAPHQAIVQALINGAEAINIVGTQNDTVTNNESGQIKGGVAMGGGADILTNDGSITALNGSAVNMGDGADTVTNQGTITGDVLLGDGADMLTNTGTITGTIDGGAGNDTIISGDGNDIIIGGAGSDNIDGGSGRDTSVYTDAVQIVASNGGWSVTSGADTDTLTNVEIVNDSAAGRILLVGNGGFATIADAISAADSGDTIMVAAGTWDMPGGDLGKSLTFLGAKSGISANGADFDLNTDGGRGTGETIIQGNGDLFRFSSTGQVTFDGFTFDGVRFDSYTDGADIALVNNIVTNPGNNLLFAGNSDTVTFEGNRVTGLVPGDNDAVFIAGNWNGTTGTAVTISGNVFADSPGASGFNLSNVHGTISNNLVDGLAYYGFLLANDTNVEVTDNTFRNITNPDPTVLTWGAGVRTYTPGSNFGLVLEGNTFDSNAVGLGIRAGSDIDPSHLTIGDNTFVGANQLHIVNQGTATTDVSLGGDNSFVGIDLSAMTDDQLLALADQIIDAVDVSGYGSVVLKAGNVYLTANSYVTGITSAPSLQRALDTTANGDTVHVGAGNYPGGQATANSQNLTITAPAAATGLSVLLGAGISNISLGGESAIAVTGNQLANTITGNAGNNLIDGGAGADSMIGGGGDDHYLVDNAGDAITEGINDGTDTVTASVTYTLTAGARVESLEAATGNAAINLTGNEFAQTITGNDASNSLNGGGDNDTLIGGAGSDTLDGGTGADSMAGGTGDDQYIVDNANDVVTELTGEGTDTVTASVSYTLTAGSYVENLVAASGAGNINLTGNDRDNRITGNAGNNLLSGGDGNDTIVGGGGSDTVNGGNGTDTLVLGTNPGTLANISGIEVIEFASGTLNASGFAGGFTITSTAGLADTITGSQGNDSINSGDGADVINYNSGNGSDTVDAGLGTDRLNVTFTGVSGDTTTDVTVAGLVATVALSGAASGSVAASGLETLSLALSGTGTDTVNLGDVGATGVTSIIVTGGNVKTLLRAENLKSPTSLTATLGTGDDTVYLGSTGNDTLNGGGGFDTLNYASSTTLVSIDLSLQQASGGGIGIDTVTNFEAIRGSRFQDALRGDNLDNTFFLSAGGDLINGRGGNDTIDGKTQTVAMTIDLGAGTAFSSAIGTTTLSSIERVIGGQGNDTIYGDAGDNYIDGYIGNDYMEGGAGNDTYVVNTNSDTVVEAVNGGIDTVISATSYALTANVENLILSGDLDRFGTGNALNNKLTGNGGANKLDGGAGNDTMEGGLGDDTYIVDSTLDVVIEAASAGTDTVQSSATFTLSDNIERLFLTGLLNINGTGNALDNTITGNDGNNILDGKAGADTMSGGLGNDTYFVNTGSDVVIEKADGGIDTVVSITHWTLGANVENLTLSGTLDRNGTGNELDNYIIGNSGNNILDGKAGADTMEGGLGNDTYYVNTNADVVIEGANAGSDTVISGTHYTLGANVENLTLSGTLDRNGTGNSLANEIRGNSGANIIDGKGGVDQLWGGAGNDVFHFTAAADTGVGAGNRDVINDFTSGADKIDLRAIGQFTFGALGGGVAHVTAFAEGANTIVAGDANGDGVADFQIQLAGLYTLTGSDFIL